MTTKLSPFPLLIAGLAVALPCQGLNLAPPTAPADVPVIGSAAGTQRNAAMAAGATSSLLVFEDNRAGDNDIFGVRIDANGAPIDVVPFPITKAPGHQTAPKVVWNGQDWLVAYLSEYDPGSGYFASRIAAVRVSGQGAVLDATPFAIGGDSTGNYFSVASDGSGWVVVWTGFSAGNSDIRARRITGAGALLDPGGVVVQPSTFSIFFQLNVAFAGGNYLFTWDQNGLRGRRLTSSLVPVDPASVAMPTGFGEVRGNGAHFLFSWVRQTPQFTNEVVAQRFGANLAALDPSPLVVSDPAITPNPSSVHTAWNGTNWVVVWTQPATDARASRVTATGSVLDPGGVLLPDNNPTGVLYSPAVGGLPGGGAMFLWNQGRFGTADDVYGIPIDASWVVGAEQSLSTGAEALRTPRTTAGAGGCLVTALAELSTGTRIVAFRLDALGNSLDPAPIEVVTANHARLQVGGAGWNGTHYLVVWADGQIGQVYGRRLNPDGSWADPAPVAVMPGFDPDVAAAGPDFLVTCLRYPSYPQFIYSFGARVRGSDAAVLDTPALLIGSSFARRVRTVELGGRWLVATQSHWSHNENQGGVSLHFVDNTGVVTAATSMAVLNMQGGGTVDLASSGTSALVVAQSGSNWTNTEVYVQRVLPNGTSPVPMSVITGGNGMGQFRPSVAWNGREYVVTYETYQNNVWFYDFEPDLYGIRIAENGSPIDAAGHPFWNGEDHEVRICGDGLGSGKALYTASVFDDALGAMRLQTRNQRPIGLTTFGTGTPGCAGTHGIDTNVPPIAGDATFTVTCDRGPQNGLGVMVLGTGAFPAGFDVGLGCLLHFDLAPPHFVVLTAMFADTNGAASVNVPLVPQAAWSGFTMVAQGLFLWPPSCQPSVSGFSSSPGLQIVVQTP